MWAALFVSDISYRSTNYLKAKPTPLYGEIVVSDDGNNLMDFAVEITKQLIRGGETFQSEILGEWETLSTSAPDYSILSRSIFVHLVENFYIWLSF